MSARPGMLARGWGFGGLGLRSGVGWGWDHLRARPALPACPWGVRGGTRLRWLGRAAAGPPEPRVGRRRPPAGRLRAVGFWGWEKVERASGFASAREGASGARLCLAERGGLGGMSARASGWLGARAPQERSRGPRLRRVGRAAAGPPQKRKRCAGLNPPFRICCL
jgi:hypothetical protein